MKSNSQSETTTFLFITVWTLLRISAAMLDEDMAALSADAPWKETEKRNTWWSKRSAIQESSDPGIDQELPLCSSVVTAVGCYVDTCIPLFFECSRTADNKASLGNCKTGHRACLVRCVRGPKIHFPSVQ
ncbi:uncharacterized protein LOC135391089 [Ornithodoros turicata]|uniref:uncharacterized protein LOC135391089 n=1 Tax=Ornithodoros turicata TaxID=34597 RepID=UPI0031391A2C